MTSELDTFDCRVTLPGWRLHIASLSANDRDLGNVMDLATRGAVNALRRLRTASEPLAHPALAVIREHLSRLDIDPGETPPCSEILIERIISRGAIDRGCLGWEFLSLLTAKSCAPWTALDRRHLKPPLTFRLGESGELLRHAAGELDCTGLPVLADDAGVKASPWTLGPPEALQDASDVVFVCYLPRELFREIGPKSHVGRAIWMTWAYRFVFERTCSYRAVES